MKRSWGLVLLALLAGTCFAQRGEPPAELKEQVAKVNKLVDDLDRTKNGKIDPNVKPNREWTDPRTGKKYPYYTSKERRAEAVKKIEAELESAQKELAEAKASLPARIHAAKMEGNRSPDSLNHRGGLSLAVVGDGLAEVVQGIAVVQA